MTILLNLTFFLQQTNPQQMLSRSPIELVLNAGVIAQVVLGILAFFSIISWGIILDKLRVFRRVRKESDKFLNAFQQKKGAREIMQASRLYPGNPFAAVYKEAFWLLNQSEGKPAGGSLGMMREPTPKQNHTSEDLLRLFDSVATREVLRLEKHLAFLATTGSVSPFFGLFGTVWGVMGAFLSIGLTGSADISVVAPGIAEALITTVAGLGAAIPAVMAYNFFVSKLKRISAELEIFYSNLIEAFVKREVNEVR